MSAAAFSYERYKMSNEELANRAMDAVEEAVANHTVGIVAGTGDQAGQGMGTGSAISFRGERFILTANHVVGDTPDDALMFFPRPENSLKRADRPDVRALEGVPTGDLYLAQRLDIANRVSDEDDDLAVLFVRGDIEERTTIRFFDLNKGGRTPEPGELVVSLGYPGDISRQLESGNFVAFSSVDWSNTVEQVGLPDYDQTRHFLKAYGMAEAEPDAHPAGFSGTGVWYRLGPTPTGELWVPNLQLAGVIVTYYPRPRLLKAVRIERVVDFLGGVFG